MLKKIIQLVMQSYLLQNLQVIYMTTVGAMSLLALLLQLHPQYFTSLWASKRLTFFGVTGMFGMIPSLHWIWIHGGFSQIIVQVQCTNSCFTITIIQT